MKTAPHAIVLAQRVWHPAPLFELVGCTCGFRCTTQIPDSEIADHFAYEALTGEILATKATPR